MTPSPALSLRVESRSLSQLYAFSIPFSPFRVNRPGFDSRIGGREKVNSDDLALANAPQVSIGFAEANLRTII